MVVQTRHPYRRRNIHLSNPAGAIGREERFHGASGLCPRFLGHRGRAEIPRRCQRLFPKSLRTTKWMSNEENGVDKGRTPYSSFILISLIARKEMSDPSTGTCSALRLPRLPTDSIVLMSKCLVRGIVGGDPLAFDYTLSTTVYNIWI